LLAVVIQNRVEAAALALTHSPRVDIATSPVSQRTPGLNRACVNTGRATWNSIERPFDRRSQLSLTHQLIQPRATLHNGLIAHRPTDEMAIDGASCSWVRTRRYRV
jgi:hypothetical protein